MRKESTGTFARAYAANRKAAIEDVVEADPVAASVREIMAERSIWTGSAADLLRIGADLLEPQSRPATSRGTDLCHGCSAFRQ
jgi:hypothetical protein